MVEKNTLYEKSCVIFSKSPILVFNLAQDKVSQPQGYSHTTVRNSVAPSSSLVCNVIICSALSVGWNSVWNVIFQKKKKKKRFPCAILFENTERIGNVSPTASVSFFDLLLLLCFSFFSGTGWLCPLADSNLSCQQRLQLLGQARSSLPPGLQVRWAKPFPRVFETQGKFCQEVGNLLISAVPVPWLPETKSSILWDCGAHLLMKQWPGEERLAVGNAFCAGAKSCGQQVGKDPALDHGTERASKSAHSEGNAVQQDRCTYIRVLNSSWAKLLIFLCLSTKEKSQFLIPSSFSWANTSLWSLDLVLIFQVCSLLVVRYPVKRKEESSLISWEQAGA